MVVSQMPCIGYSANLIKPFTRTFALSMEPAHSSLRLLSHKIPLRAKSYAYSATTLYL